MDLQIGDRIQLKSITGRTTDNSWVRVTDIKTARSNNEDGRLVFLWQEPQKAEAGDITPQLKLISEKFGYTMEELQKMVGNIEEDKGHYLQPYWISDSVDNSYRMNLTLMPDIYRGKLAKDFRFDKYRDAEAITKVKNLVNAYLVNFEDIFMAQSRGLYIYSHIKGSGKTLLACCIGNEIAQRYGYSVKFITAADYLQIVKDKNEELKQSIKDCSLLILDDFGVQGDKDWITETFFGLINRRNTNMCSTIITSNIPMTSDKIEDRIGSRIKAMCFDIKLPEQSIRDEMAEESKRKVLEEILG